MEEFGPSRFIVKEPKRSAFGNKSKTHLWFKAIEIDVEPSVRIPLFHESYDESMENKLRELSEGDLVKATLEGGSGNWRVVEFELSS